MSISVVAASAARTTSSQSTAFTVPEGKDFDLSVTVTAASGTTPTADFSVEWSHNGTVWYRADPADTFTQITTTGNVVKHFVAKAAYARLVWAVAGTTPSFTFASDVHVANAY